MTEPDEWKIDTIPNWDRYFRKFDKSSNSHFEEKSSTYDDVKS